MLAHWERRLTTASKSAWFSAYLSSEIQAVESLLIPLTLGFSPPQHGISVPAVRLPCPDSQTQRSDAQICLAECLICGNQHVSAVVALTEHEAKGGSQGRWLGTFFLPVRFFFLSDVTFPSKLHLYERFLVRLQQIGLRPVLRRCTW